MSDRASGRTSRMMDAATAAAESGVRVLVLAADHQYAEALRRHWPKVPVQTVERTPVGMDCALWEDHYARGTYEVLRGEAIRRAALLEAADIADQHASVEGIAQRISAQIRALAEEEK